jgi:hypothetical protein
MASFEEIPYEVFFTYLLPLLDMGAIGALTATCKVWRDMCEDNEVWKHLYMRTIRVKIEDTSIHIGGTYERYRDIRGERRTKESPLYYIACPITTGYYPNPGVTVNEPYLTGSVTWWWARNTNELLSNHPCLSRASNAAFVSTLKTWREVRDDGIDNDEFIKFGPPTATMSVWGKRDVFPYLSYVEDAWIKYNREHGLSTGANLCQCVEHYQFETLGLPAGCRNYKCFKKMTLKKERTKVEKQSKKASKDYDKMRREYEAAVRVMERAEKEMLKAREEDKKITRLLDNLDNVPGVKKIKKQTVGIAHPNPNITWWHMGAQRRQKEHSEAAE